MEIYIFLDPKARYGRSQGLQHCEDLWGTFLKTDMSNTWDSFASHTQIRPSEIAVKTFDSIIASK